MIYLDLPNSTKVNRVVPKNSFDKFTNSKQKKSFSDAIQRITWTHKLSPNTVNLEAKDVEEIQVFKVELKQKVDIIKLLDIIHRSIPYNILFVVEFENQSYVSTASKHIHPTNVDLAVIDWVFTSEWHETSYFPFKLNLKGSLDAVFKDFCIQITGKPEFSKMAMQDILENQQKIDELKKEIQRLNSSISKSKQFNEKVEFNLILKKKEAELEGIMKI